jgi:hypothetical protein
MEKLLGERKPKEPLASPANQAEALKWVRSHPVGSAGRRSLRQRGELRLSPEALPAIASLLGSTDQAIVMTVSLALMYNGAKLDSDATPNSDPTIFRVTMPNGVVCQVPVEST